MRGAGPTSGSELSQKRTLMPWGNNVLFRRRKQFDGFFKCVYEEIVMWMWKVEFLNLKQDSAKEIIFNHKSTVSLQQVGISHTCYT